MIPIQIVSSPKVRERDDEHFVNRETIKRNVTNEGLHRPRQRFFTEEEGKRDSIEKPLPIGHTGNRDLSRFPKAEGNCINKIQEQETVTSSSRDEAKTRFLNTNWKSDRPEKKCLSNHLQAIPSNLELHGDVIQETLYPITQNSGAGLKACFHLNEATDKFNTLTQSIRNIRAKLPTLKLENLSSSSGCVKTQLTKGELADVPKGKRSESRLCGLKNKNSWFMETFKKGDMARDQFHPERENNVSGSNALDLSPGNEERQKFSSPIDKYHSQVRAITTPTRCNSVSNVGYDNLEKRSEIPETKTSFHTSESNVISQEQDSWELERPSVIMKSLKRELKQKLKQHSHDSLHKLQIDKINNDKLAIPPFMPDPFPCSRSIKTIGEMTAASPSMPLLVSEIKPTSETEVNHCQSQEEPVDLQMKPTFIKTSARGNERGVQKTKDGPLNVEISSKSLEETIVSSQNHLIAQSSDTKLHAEANLNLERQNSLSSPSIHTHLRSVGEERMKGRRSSSMNRDSLEIEPTVGQIVRPADPKKKSTHRGSCVSETYFASDSILQTTSSGLLEPRGSRNGLNSANFTSAQQRKDNEDYSIPNGKDSFTPSSNPPWRGSAHSFTSNRSFRRTQDSQDPFSCELELSTEVLDRRYQKHFPSESFQSQSTSKPHRCDSSSIRSKRLNYNTATEIINLLKDEMRILDKEYKSIQDTLNWFSVEEVTINAIKLQAIHLNSYNRSRLKARRFLNELSFSDLTRYSFEPSMRARSKCADKTDVPFTSSYENVLNGISPVLTSTPGGNSLSAVESTAKMRKNYDPHVKMGQCEARTSGAEKKTDGHMGFLSGPDETDFG